MSERKVNYTSQRPSGESIKRSISNVNPDAPDTDVAQFVVGVSTLSDNTLTGIEDEVIEPVSIVPENAYYFESKAARYQNANDSVQIHAANFNDSIYNTGDNVTIYSGGGKDTIFSTGSDCCIVGSSLNNSLFTGGQNFSIQGAANNFISNTGNNVTIMPAASVSCSAENTGDNVFINPKTAAVCTIYSTGANVGVSLASSVQAILEGSGYSVCGNYNSKYTYDYVRVYADHVTVDNCLYIKNDAPYNSIVGNSWSYISLGANSDYVTVTPGTVINTRFVTGDKNIVTNVASFKGGLKLSKDDHHTTIHLLANKGSQVSLLSNFNAEEDCFLLDVTPQNCTIYASINSRDTTTSVFHVKQGVTIDGTASVVNGNFTISSNEFYNHQTDSVRFIFSDGTDTLITPF